MELFFWKISTTVIVIACVVIAIIGDDKGDE